jgi:hypothetical protein
MAAGTPAPDAPSPPMSDASEDLPNIAPLKGPVPLPRRRPNVVAMAEPAQSGLTQTGVPSAGVPLAGVPLPRARPVDAPAAPADAPPSDAPSFDRDVAH